MNDSVWIAPEGQTIQDVFSDVERCAFLEHGCLCVGDAMELVPGNIQAMGVRGEDDDKTYKEKLRLFPYHVLFEPHAGDLLYRLTRLPGMPEEQARLFVGRFLGAIVLMPPAHEPYWADIHRRLQMEIRWKHVHTLTLNALKAGHEGVQDPSPPTAGMAHISTSLNSDVFRKLEQLGFEYNDDYNTAFLRPRGLERLKDLPTI